MKKIIDWSKPVVCWTIVAIASMQGTALSQVQRVAVSPGSLMSPSRTAKPGGHHLSTTQADTAQAFPGKCAMAREEIFVYNSPATSGQRIRSLGPSEQVALADEGMNGWIAIDSPIKGFVQIKNLKLCSPIGECRAAKQGIFLYDKPDSSGRKIRSILTNEEVTIAGTNENGWIAISSPANGFVQTVDLKSCDFSRRRSRVGGNRPPGENTGSCRRVTDLVGRGLNIRAQPNTESDIIGSLFAGDIVRLKSTENRVDPTGRNWVAIASPQEGWISEGFWDSDFSGTVGRNLEAAACPR
ncbi:MAG: SH3 domain-containing protein [Hormoscilla sp. SP5CHS1]|nr:SH3 domain-containing protein [Hormoscilla sp. SP12CHS1]MBC6452996.1 SH3 domain-containing protein [Hormoscilla sp. SP5CHS1]